MGLPAGYERLSREVSTSFGALRRVKSSADGKVYWLKSFSDEYPSDAILLHIDAELRSAELCRREASAIARLNDDRRCWVLYGDASGEPLRLDEPWTEQAFSRAALAITRALAEAHELDLLFGWLEPACVLWNEATGEAHLVGAVARSDRGRVLALRRSSYAAPELVHPAVDISVASDLYSLGCILHHMLTGRAPMDGPGDGELRADVPFEGSIDGAPQPWVELLRCMLAKSPAERPESARVVLDTLEGIKSGPSAPVSSVVFRPQRIVGRRGPLEQLTSFVTAAQNSGGQLIFVCGEPGVGKSSLLGELKKWALVRRRPVAQGKFDQYRMGRPYSALLSAFESALELALSNEDAGYQQYRERFAVADRTLLGVLTSDLPHLEHFAGRLPVAPRLGPSETEHRFRRAFRHLLERLCEPTRPLLLMLEDLQWADRATLDMLEDWSVTGLPDYMALVCSYREEEARAEAHVRKFVDAMATARRVQLEPLELEAITQLCCVAVPSSMELPELARVVHRQSRGNPLHAVEILKALAGRHRGGSTPQSLRRKLYELRVDDLSDTVLGLITSRMQQFDALTQRTVIAASCVGPQFSSVLLAVALDEDSGGVIDAIRFASTEGIFTRLPETDDVYSFSHDRTQQAAFALGSDELKANIRLRLGRHYLKAARSNRECLFGAVEHLNCVRDALTADERNELAQLNWRAAFLAKESIAYERAVSLFIAFERDAHAVSEEARFSAALALAECTFLTSTLERAEVALEQALAVAVTPKRELIVLQTWQEICQHQQRYPEAIRILLRALGQLSYRLPERPAVPRVLWGIARLMLRTRKLVPAELAKRGDDGSPEDRAILQLLLMLWGPSLWSNQNLNGLVVVHLMTLTLRVGNAPGSAMAYLCYAVLNHVLFGRHEVALEYSRLGVAQLERDGNAIVATRVRFLALTFFGAFEREPKANVEAYEQALRHCIANGELLASHLLDGIVTTLPTHGYSLSAVFRLLQSYEGQARQVRAESTIELIGLTRHWARELAERGGPELANMPVTFPSYIGFRDLLAMQLGYLWDDDALVLTLAARVRGDVIVRANPLHRAMYCLFGLLARCRSRRALDREGRRALQSLRRFAKIFPLNFRSFLLLGEAEVTALKSDTTRAVDSYRRAMEESAARGHELLHAICVERLALFHDARDQRDRRDDCLRAAAFAYTRFGAFAKAQHLRRKYPDVAWGASRSHESSGAVDLRVEAVMKAASAIAAETSSERLAPAMVRVVATASSCERVALLQRLGEDWMVLSAWHTNVGDLLPAPISIACCEFLSHGVVRYVTRTTELVNLVLGDNRFAEDAHLTRARPRSVLCVPISHRGDVNAMLYLENSLYSDSFTSDQVRLVEMLGRQAAIALANSETHRLRIEAVQARVNPHFLYNTLNVVAELVATAPEKAEAVVLKLSHLYRAMLSSSADRMVTLEQELSLVRDYLELEQARFGDKLAVEWSVDESLYPADVPSLLLQPLVENAVHHGIRRKQGRGTIKICAESDGACLLLAVKDDGPGWYASTGGNGFGLRSVEKRLSLLYGGKAQLRIEREHGVTVRIQLPLG